ncbi:MAG: ABC transporter permease subunit [Thermoanaerobaculaceae bacterium]|jgi:phosphate transport system permease protein|nr:ABC transporter permease subunit [Thermoanaerobaculaceae bacterium]
MSPLGPAHLRRSRLVDRVVAGAITTGGSLVLVAVTFLMVFLLAQCLPMLRGGDAHPERTVGASHEALAAFEDEYRERVTVLGRDGSLVTVDRAGQAAVGSLEGATPPLRQAVVSSPGDLLACEDASGALKVWSVRTAVRWGDAGRTISTEVTPTATLPGAASARILAVAGSAESPSVLLQADDGATLVSGEGAPARTLTLGAPAVAGALSHDAREAWLASASGLATFAVGDADPAAGALVATAPLGSPPTALALVLGDVTCLLGDASGMVTAWQVVSGPVAGSRVLDLAGRFPGTGPVRSIAISQRNKCFAVDRGGLVQIAHLTGRRVLVDVGSAPLDAVLVGLSRRFDGLFAVTGAGAVHRWRLDAPHPELSASVLFLPVRYEGYTKADLVWQSTGGSETNEPKLSLVPLIVGTLKGALYALLFSGPCALAAALYVSQFAPSRLRAVVKPVVELMAAVPSVVVGFLAALLVAPLVQRHIVGTLLMLIVLPAVVVGAAAVFQTLPGPWRRGLSTRSELLLIAGLLAAALVLCFTLDTAIEGALFGGDFKGWLLAAAGITYDQRNAVVVGFALGFAVIPIIFTLAEDAFSNVPPSLISASLALGATRWQAARTVAIPAASPGLFAALMNGLGRAVGETMIVLMATGNTPVLSLSPFNGMRTMAACIAVELPEAPHGGSLYRVLILTALLLFAMTFVTNTAAAVVASRLRKRFGRLAA